MVKNSTLLILVFFLFSCTKEKAHPVDLVIDESHLKDIKPGSTLQFFSVNSAVTPLPIIYPGNNQYWDFSNLAVKNEVAVNYLRPDPDPNFATATYMQRVVDQFLGKTSNSKYYGEITPAGIASLGRRIERVLVADSTKTLILPAQSIKLSKKLYSVNFPLRFQDSTGEKGIKEVTKMFITAMPLYSPNTPGTETHTTDYSNEAIACGTMRLKGFSEPFPVIVLRHIVSTKYNYLINGARASDSLLASVGARENEIRTTVTFSFYSPVHGFVGSIHVVSDKAVLGGTFKRNF